MEESCVAIDVFFGKSKLRFFSSVHTTANVQSARYPILPRAICNLVPHCILFLRRVRGPLHLAKRSNHKPHYQNNDGVMGGTHSTSEPKSGANNVQNSSLESSSGFHLMEIHFPTLGAGMGLVVLGAIILYMCLKKARQSRRSNRPHHIQVRPMATFPHDPFGPFAMSDHRDMYPNMGAARALPNPRFREVTCDLYAEEQEVVMKKAKKPKKADEEKC